MVLVDTALARRAAEGRPIRLAILGAGYLCRAVTDQVVNRVPGIRVAAIACRRAESGIEAYRVAGCTDIRTPSSLSTLEDAVEDGRCSVVEDPFLACRASNIDVVLEAVGVVPYAAEAAIEAIRNGKHFIANAELDATLGPVLKAYADRAGVVFSGIDGDQPGTEMNLYRFVRGMGLLPLVCGNIKALQDPYRTPSTQAAFAERWGLSPREATNFADGSKISFEQASVANATGMRVAKRGMVGFVHDGHVDELTSRFDVDVLRGSGGIVDYALGAKPGPGVFVLAAEDCPRQRHRLRLYKMGDGPLYSFYAPYHLAHFEVPNGIARAVLFRDAVVAAAAGPCVDVIATAKRNLEPGEVLDGIGGYTLYGQCENHEVVRSQHLLPLGIADGCRVKRRVPKDEVMTSADVEFPTGRACDVLRREQDAIFSRAAAASGSD